MRNNCEASLRVSIVLLLGLLSQCGFATAQKTAASVASQLGEEFARTVNQSADKPGRAVLVLEERHNSRSGQLQEAIVLERLYHDFAVREVVLEGYLVDDPSLDPTWLDEAAAGSQLRRARVAVQLLREGEINAAEFLKMVHPEVAVLPAESKAEHEPTTKGAAYQVVDFYLMRLAAQLGEKALRQNPGKTAEIERLVSEMKRLAEELEDLKGPKAAEALVEKKQKEAAEVFRTYKETIIGLDPWTSRMWKEYQESDLGGEKPSLEASARIAKAVKEKADNLGIKVENKAKEAMRDYIAFMQARHEGTLKIAGKLRELTGRRGPPVAAIIGIGHSRDLALALDALECSYAFLRPTALEGDASDDIPGEMYERKYARRSIFSGGPLDLVVKTIPDRKKPPVVMNEPWLVGKGEAYAFIDRITDDVFGDGPPYGRPKLPPDWGEGGFHGRHVYIDRKRIELVDDDNEVIVVTDETLEKLGEENLAATVLNPLVKLKDQPFLTEKRLFRKLETLIGPEAVRQVERPLLRHVVRRKQASIIVPLVFNRGTGKETVLWVKATRGEAHVKSEEREAVEALLKAALEVTGEPGRVTTESSTDSEGRLQISFDTVAAFGSESAARTASLAHR